ncbi:MAG: molybdenum cofactor guanylyltransferase [Peptococcaceae bacterium]|nr:molybdenum cofactor guanylyltransferase [Peptococcaceae bacterium]
MAREMLQVTGVLLTGGESRRMGKNKALLELDGKPLIERTLDILRKTCSEVVISSRSEDLYSSYGYQVIPDIFPGKGPLGGLYSVLQKASYEYLFLAACDMPFLDETSIRYIYSRMDDFDAIVPYALGRMHPLHAFYHKRITPLVEEKIQKDQLRIVDVLSECRMKILKSEDGEDFYKNRIDQSVVNVNTPDEWVTMLNKVKN